MISVKNLKFLLCLILLENDLDMMFNNVLKGKKGFFLRGYPTIFVKTLKFLLSLIFFEKDLDMVFNNVK